MTSAALAWRYVHDRQGEALRGNGLGVAFAGSARPDEAMLGAAKAFDSGIREGVPVGYAIDEASHAALEQILDFHDVLRCWCAELGGESVVPQSPGKVDGPGG